MKPTREAGLSRRLELRLGIRLLFLVNVSKEVVFNHNAEIPSLLHSTTLLVSLGHASV